MSILFNRPMLDVNVKLMMDGIPYQKTHHGKVQYLPISVVIPSQKLCQVELNSKMRMLTFMDSIFRWMSKIIGI